MKKFIPIIIILIFSMSYGQNEIELINDKTQVIDIFYITDKCSNLNNRFQNDRCVMEEINRFVNLNTNPSLIINLPKGDNRILISLLLEKDGEISKVTAESEHEKVNKEFERLFLLFPNRIKAIDENGNTYKRRMRFYMEISAN